VAPRERTPRPLGKCKCSASGAKMTTPRPQGKCKCASEGQQNSRLLDFASRKQDSAEIGRAETALDRRADAIHRTERHANRRTETTPIPDRPTDCQLPRRDNAIRRTEPRRQSIPSFRTETMPIAAPSPDANRLPIATRTPHGDNANRCTEPRRQSPHRVPERQIANCQLPSGTPIAAPSRDANHRTEPRIPDQQIALQSRCMRLIVGRCMRIMSACQLQSGWCWKGRAATTESNNNRVSKSACKNKNCNTYNAPLHCTSNLSLQTAKCRAIAKRIGGMNGHNSPTHEWRLVVAALADCLLNDL
jgi:hypothetical protein